MHNRRTCTAEDTTELDAGPQQSDTTAPQMDPKWLGTACDSNLLEQAEKKNIIFKLY